MNNPINDPRYFDRKGRQVRTQAAVVLKRWGLLPRFKRWRLTEDPGTGMIVLFGILNNRYIAMHTSTPFSDYFDPRLLHDLAQELQIQVVSCNGDGLRYAFVLERGQIDVLPTHIDYPFVEGDRLFVRVAYESNPPLPVMLPPSGPPQRWATASTTSTLVHRGVGAFLNIFDEIELRDDAATQARAQAAAPDILLIDQGEFNRRVAALEAGRAGYQGGLAERRAL